MIYIMDVSCFVKAAIEFSLPTSAGHGTYPLQIESNQKSRNTAPELQLICHYADKYRLKRV